MKKKMSMICRSALLSIRSLLFTGILVISGFVSAEAAQFFAQRSTWYEKIPASPQVMANSANYVNFVSSVASLAVSYHEWSVPVWKASVDTPMKAVRVLGFRMSQVQLDTRTVQVPIPQAARPAGYKGNTSCFSGNTSDCYRDGHMVVISADGKSAWDFANLGKPPDRPELLVSSATRWDWATAILQKWDLTTDGINQPFDLAKQGGRVSPIPLLHGIITYEEIQKGYIDHAIAFAYGGPVSNPGGAKAGSPGVYPCVGPNSGNGTNQWDPWLGFRFQLDPTLDINSLNLTPAGKVIARALQEYGMIFVENGGPGNNAIYAEDLTGKPNSWGPYGSLFGDLSKIPLNKMRVVNPIYPSAISPGSSSVVGTKPTAPTNLRVGQ